MIDDITIEKAAIIYEQSREGRLGMCESFSSFVAGAEWANEQFIKTLWHNTSETPYDECYYLVNTKQGNIEICFYNNKEWSKLKEEGDEVIMWLSLDEILP